MKKLIFLLLGILILGAIAIGGYVSYKNYALFSFLDKEEEKPVESKDAYTDLVMESYYKTQENFWRTLEDKDLTDLYLQALRKTLEKPSLELSSSTPKAVRELFEIELNNITDTNERKEITLQTIQVVLYNLPPQGRNKLFTKAEETKLRNRVANIDENKDLYQALELEKGASSTEIEEAFKKKSEILAASSSKEAKEKLKEVKYAKEVLTDTENKRRYDENQIEPTISEKLLHGIVLYMDIEKIAPTTLEEFVNIASKVVASDQPQYLIIDLRGNEGGALDFAPYFLGIFKGPNQYAADLFQQGERKPLRSPEGIPKIKELQNFKDIVVLTDKQTQSTAELLAAVLKRYNMATIVGQTTKGWGSVENTFPLETQIEEDESYSLFLVHSLTLREDQQPIESNGVIPDVSTDGINWQTNLSKYIENSSLKKAVIEVIND